MRRQPYAVLINHPLGVGRASVCAWVLATSRTRALVEARRLLGRDVALFDPTSIQIAVPAPLVLRPFMIRGHQPQWWTHPMPLTLYKLANDLRDASTVRSRRYRENSAW